jgi:hypothetical protein
VISPPGNVAPPRTAWSERVSGLIDEAVTASLAGVERDGRPEPFYNPVREELEAIPVPVTWPALSGTLRSLDFLPEEQRWTIADQARTTPVEVPGTGRSLFGQDEYCEWSVRRDENDDIICVTFTSEVREWFEHLSANRPALVELYRDLTGEEVQEDQIFSGDGYNPTNEINTRTDGPIAHLAQQNNNLQAAIALAAESSVLRTIGGAVVTDTNVLVECSGLGDADRFSDPSIATTVNGAAAQGARITLADPPGLYLAGIRTEGMRLIELPSGFEELTPDDLWVPERGDAEHVVRARFEAPERAFPLTKVLLDGRPITTGAQLAERVDVSLTALVNLAGQQPLTKPCR